MTEDWLVCNWSAKCKMFITNKYYLNNDFSNCFVKVCGGGPRLALYHLRSLTMSKVLLEEDNYGVNSLMFHEDNVIVGVNGPFVYHCLFSGDVSVKMPTTPLRVYSMCVQKVDVNKVNSFAIELQHFPYLKNENCNSSCFVLVELAKTSIFA